MSLLIIEVFLCITFVILIYQCCLRGARHARQQYEGEGSTSNNNDNDLARGVRERIRSDPFDRARADASANNANDNSESAIEARKVLINKNLFSRQIVRGEESVKELSVLLAISRGGVRGGSSGIDDNDVDEELGVSCNNNAVSSSIIATEVPTQSEDGASPTPPIPDEPEISISAAPQSQPEPSAPPSFEEVAATNNTVVDTVATAISSSQHNIDVEQSTATTTIRASELNSSSQQRRPLDPIGNLWSNLTSNSNLNSERETTISTETTLPKSSTNFQKGCTVTTSSSRNTHHTKNGIVQHKLECSICLEHFASGDIIAWAKDGGDPPPSTLNTAPVATNNDAGCDHVFHKDCLQAWLLDHSECPLCRRLVVHTDADTRFYGWEM